MSGNYRAICLSHDPGIIIDRDLRYEEANNLKSRDAVRSHEQCDIIIGRWSGALCELACLGMQLPGPTGCKCRHGSIEWTDADWLRLLHAAQPHADAELLRRHTFGCWPAERLHRLRDELGLPTSAMTAQG